MSRRVLLSTRVCIGFFFLFLTFILSGCFPPPESTSLKLENAGITLTVHEDKSELYPSFRAVDVKVNLSKDDSTNYTVKGNGILEFYIDHNNVKLKIQDHSLKIIGFGNSVEINNAKRQYQSIAIGKTGFVLVGYLLPHSYEIEKLDEVRANDYRIAKQFISHNDLITD